MGICKITSFAFEEPDFHPCHIDSPNKTKEFKKEGSLRAQETGRIFLMAVKACMLRSSWILTRSRRKKILLMNSKALQK